MTPLPAPTGHPSYSVTLPCQPERSREARQLVMHALGAWGLDHLRDEAVLAVSELFTNTLEHTASKRVRVTVARTGGRMVRISVVDRSPRSTPTRREAGWAAEHGRGLALVEAMCRDWGVDRLGWGKRVWCEFSCTC